MALLSGDTNDPICRVFLKSHRRSFGRTAVHCPASNYRELPKSADNRGPIEFAKSPGKRKKSISRRPKRLSRQNRIARGVNHHRRFSVSGQARTRIDEGSVGRKAYKVLRSRTSGGP